MAATIIGAQTNPALQRVKALSTELDRRQPYYNLHDLYFKAEQKVQNLGIAIPPKLAVINSVLGWPRILVEAIENRSVREGFIYPDASEVDDELEGIYQYNKLDAEEPLAALDSLVYGTSYWVVGPSDDPEYPLITIESPRNMIAKRDRLGRNTLESFQVYSGGLEAVYQNQAAVYDLARDDVKGEWSIVDVQDNQLGEVLVHPMSNRARIHDRHGRSEITPDIRSTTDAACRTLLSLEIAREFYSVPQKYMLGVEEEQFKNAKGDKVDPWTTYMSVFLSLPRDADGELPSVGQFQAYDPSVFTKVLDQYAHILVGQSGLPPEYFGITTSNPAAADAIRAGQDRIIRRTERFNTMAGDTLEEVMRSALKVKYDGVIDDRAKLLETVWRDPATPTLSAQADATGKLVAAGILPPRSTVTMSRSGLTRAEQARVLLDWETDAGQAALEALTAQLTPAEAAPAQPVAAPPAFIAPGS